VESGIEEKARYVKKLYGFNCAVVLWYCTDAVPNGEGKTGLLWKKERRKERKKMGSEM